MTLARLRIFKKVDRKRNSNDILNVPIVLPTLVSGEKLIVEISPSASSETEPKETDDLSFKGSKHNSEEIMRRREEEFVGRSLTRKIKILILAAKPNRLRLDQEIYTIDHSIRLSKNRDLFELKTCQAATLTTISRCLEDEKPQIVHFCGHGSPDGLKLDNEVFSNDTGAEIVVKPEILAKLFSSHSEYVKCVLLNACYSEKTAEALRQYINYVISVDQNVENIDSIRFAEGFYDTLGSGSYSSGEEFERAFKQANLRITYRYADFQCDAKYPQFSIWSKQNDDSKEL